MPLSPSRICRALSCVSLFASALRISLSAASAQVITDGTIGPTATLAGPDYAIGAELGTQRGGNLFHSFERFGIPTGGSATFSGPDSVTNVISRVTGGGVSSIDGTLRSTIPGADVFVVNPSGVVFGPNARLEVQGAFAASTASEITFPDGGRFSATDSGPSILSVAPPEAFGFMDAPSGTLRIDGSQITVSDNLTFIAPEVVIDGTNGAVDLEETRDPGGFARLMTRGGDLRIESPGASGVVRMDRLPPPRPAETDGSVRLFRTRIDTSGAPSGEVRLVAGDVVVEKTNIAAENTSDEAGGGLFVTGQTVAFREDPFDFETYPLDDPFTNTGNQGRYKGPRSFINIDNGGSGGGGGVKMRAEEIELSGAFSIVTRAFGSGTGGDMIFEASDITILEGVLGPTTFGAGDSGDLIIAADRFVLDGNESGLRVYSGFATDTRGSGDGGDIIVDAREVELIDGGRFGSFVTPPSEIIDGERVVTGNATGKGGDVTVRAQSIVMRGEDAFRTGIDANTEGDGAAGNLAIRASESIVLDGMVGLGILAADPNDFRGQVQLRTASFDDSGKNGPAGDISVTTNSLEMFGVAVIDASTFTAADGGAISIQSGFVQLTHGAAFATRSRGNNGNPGSISVVADTVIFGPTPPDNAFGPTGISTIAFGSADSPTGVAGGVNIEARTIDIQQGTFFDALTFRPGLAGDVSLTATEMIYVAGGRQLSSGSLLGPPATNGTRINAGAAGGGTGGNIRLSAPVINITRAAVVGANTGGTGDGGTIVVDGGNLTVSGGARLDAGTLGTGTGGDIVVNALGSAVLDGANSGLFVESALNAPDAGLAGSIFVDTPDLRIVNGAQISTDAAIADGGNITIDAIEIVYLSDSAITTSVGDGDGGGGNIVIDPVFVVLDRSSIQANARGGPGGNITIVADHFIASADSIVEASSDLNVDGTVTISSPETDLSGAVTQLSEELLDAAERLAAQCGARGGEARASFVGRGRSGLPVQPDDAITALYRDPGEAPGGREIAMLPGQLKIRCEGAG